VILIGARELQSQSCAQIKTFIICGIKEVQKESRTQLSILKANSNAAVEIVQS